MAGIEIARFYLQLGQLLFQRPLDYRLWVLRQSYWNNMYLSIVWHVVWHPKITVRWHINVYAHSSIDTPTLKCSTSSDMSGISCSVYVRLPVITSQAIVIAIIVWHWQSLDNNIMLAADCQEVIMGDTGVRHHSSTALEIRQNLCGQI